jgi:hypothetical protein
MNEKLKELAVQAGMEWDTHSWCWLANPPHLERFAELVRQDAMEEAAKICDELNYNGMNSLHCAQAIRNRAEE